MPRLGSTPQKQLEAAGIYRDYRSTQAPGYQTLSFNSIGFGTCTVLNNNTSTVSICKTAGGSTTASFTASMIGTSTLYVSAIISGSIQVGTVFTNTTVTGGAIILANLTGTGTSGASTWIIGDGTNTIATATFTNLTCTANVGYFWWDTAAVTNTTFSAPFTIEWQNTVAIGSDPGTNYCMIGISTVANTVNGGPGGYRSPNYMSLDWGFYPLQSNVSYTYTLAEQRPAGGTAIAWNSASTNYIVYDTNGFLSFYNGATKIYSPSYYSYQAFNPVYIKYTGYSVTPSFSLATPNVQAAITNIRVYNRAWNGTAYV
jgi:hypothetical protein